MAFQLNLLALSLLHPISVPFTMSLSPSAAFYLYNYSLPFYLPPFLSLNSPSHTMTILCLILLCILCPFQFLSFVGSSCSHCLSLSGHLIVLPINPPPPPYLFSHHHHQQLVVCQGFSSSPPDSRSPFYFTYQPISPLVAAAKCTLYWCQGTAYHFHYSQRAIENGVYSRRRARHALLGVSQASLISNYTVWLEFLSLNGVSMLFQSDLGMKPPRVTKQVVVGATAISSESVGRHQRSDSCCCLFFFNRIQCAAATINPISKSAGTKHTKHYANIRWEA